MKIYKIIFVALLAAAALVGCGGQQAPPAVEGPTDVLKKFVDASQKKDVETIKQTLSAGTLKRIEESAKRQNTTLDEALKKDDGNALKQMPETRNEQIEGDAATVEIKNAATADWDKIPFVKEDGKWKIALDKFMEDFMKRLSEQTKIPNSDIPKPNDRSTANSSNQQPETRKKP